MQQSGSTGNTGASNIVYDLVAIQYHALKGAQVYDQYLQDARQCGNQEIVQFIERVQQQDRERALQVHQLLARFTTSSGQQIDLTAGQDGQAAQDGQAMAGAGAASGATGTTQS